MLLVVGETTFSLAWWQRYDPMVTKCTTSKGQGMDGGWILNHFSLKRRSSFGEAIDHQAVIQ